MTLPAKPLGLTGARADYAPSSGVVICSVVTRDRIFANTGGQIVAC